MGSRTDHVIATFTAVQYGLVTTEQLAGVGLHRQAVWRRVKAGALVRVGRGVLRHAAAPPTFEQRALAAVLAAGKGSFASHETAAQLWGLPLAGGASIEYTTVLERSPVTKGARRHRSRLIEDSDHTVLRGIPIATPERTVVDLSSRLDARALGRLADDALHRGITTLVRIEASAARLPQAPGRSPKKLTILIDRRLPGARESTLEDFVFDALHRYRVPLPVCQYEFRVKGKLRRIDCCYPDAWLALEIQGFEVHGRRSQFDADALRGNELQLAGFRVLQFTSALTDHTIAVHVAEALHLPPPPAVPKPRRYAEWLHRRVAR